MQNRARRLIMGTLAGIAVIGLGGGELPRLPGESGANSALQAISVAGLLSPTEAYASVRQQPPAAAPSRKQTLSSKRKGKSAATKSATAVSRSKRKKKSRQAKKLTAKRQYGRGRCEPQSLTYARQRSGILRSRTGRENGPLTWFTSETKLGKTTMVPLSGSVLILGSDRGHGMPTGHVAYVEQAFANGPSSYRVVFSHTNYDRRCSLETNIEAEYDSAAKTLDIYSGAWQVWGKGLKVAGFIEQ